MADPIITKEELELTRNLSLEYLNILDIKRKMVAAAQAELNIEKASIESLKNKDEELYNASKSVLGIKEAILRVMRSHGTVSEGLKAAYVTQSNILKQIQKTREQDLENQEKMKKGWEDLDGKFGGLIVKGKKMKDVFNLSPGLFFAGIAAAVLLYTFKQIYNVFDQLDSAAADFRKSMGMIRPQSAGIEKEARGIAIQLMAIGVTAKDVYESFKSIADEAGSTFAQTEGLVKDMAVFSAQFGITAKASGQFLKSMAMIGKTTMDASKDMLMVAQGMASAAGVPLDEIMQDVASAAKESYQYISKNPLELIKAAVNAKELGTSLQSAVKSSASLLNFTDSVKKEMEASVLLGEGLNLQKARELAYHRDIKGLNNEILKLAKETNFEQLDPFQQNAVADAFGKSAGEIASMLESDREHQHVLAAMDDAQRARYKEMTEMNNSQTKSYAEKARAELQTMSNQKAIAAISAAWSSIFAKLGETVLPHIATVLEFVAKHMKLITSISVIIGTVWLANRLLMMNMSLDAYKLGNILGTVLMKSKELVISNTAGYMKFGNYIKSLLLLIPGISTIGTTIMTTFSSVGVWLVSIFSSIGSGLLAVVMSPISWIIAAFAAGFGIGTLLNKFKFVQEAAQAVWLAVFKIGDGIAAVGGMIYDSLKKPFIDMWNWLKGTFLGNSPSQLGLMLVDGITAVGGMIMNALISPFTMAWDFIKGLPIISNIASLFGGKNIGLEVIPQANPIVNMDRTVNADVESKTQTKSNTEMVGVMDDIISKKMDAVVNAINCLRDDMKNGTLKAVMMMDNVAVNNFNHGVGRKMEFIG